MPVGQLGCCYSPVRDTEGALIQGEYEAEQHL